MANYQEKLKALSELLQQEQIERLHKEGLSCEANVLGCQVSIKEGRKYTKIDVGRSGKYMVEKSTELIFGIKAYGVIHRGHCYGTLNTIQNWYWGGYGAVEKQTPAP